MFSELPLATHCLKKAFNKKPLRNVSQNSQKSTYRPRLQTYRSSCLQIFLKIGVIKKLAKLTRKQLCRSLFLTIRLATFLKRDSNTNVFLWILRNFWRHFFTEHLQRTDALKLRQFESNRCFPVKKGGCFATSRHLLFRSQRWKC